jgi:hypothetical protein
MNITANTKPHTHCKHISISGKNSITKDLWSVLNRITTTLAYFGKQDI